MFSLLFSFFSFPDSQSSASCLWMRIWAKFVWNPVVISTVLYPCDWVHKAWITLRTNVRKSSKQDWILFSASPSLPLRYHTNENELVRILCAISSYYWTRDKCLPNGPLTLNADFTYRLNNDIVFTVFLRSHWSRAYCQAGQIPFVLPHCTDWLCLQWTSFAIYSAIWLEGRDWHDLWCVALLFAGRSLSKLGQLLVLLFIKSTPPRYRCLLFLIEILLIILFRTGEAKPARRLFTLVLDVWKCDKTWSLCLMDYVNMVFPFLFPRLVSILLNLWKTMVPKLWQTKDLHKIPQWPSKC